VTIEDLLHLLSADDIKERVRALVWAEAEGPQSASTLVSVLCHERANLAAKVWAMMAIARLGRSVIPVVQDPVKAKLADNSPTVRRAAIQTLTALKDVSARDAIAGLVADETLDPSAWFDDDCTVSQAARAAIETLDSLKPVPA
jgi:HEAT repeat protein